MIPKRGDRTAPWSCCSSAALRNIRDALPAEIVKDMQEGISHRLTVVGDGPKGLPWRSDSRRWA
jgi:hypothetical protein